ncbi:MAG: HAD family hydrolase [Clostridia bacterium]|nr:HAD family hydrolase [Clostridia bacterium]MBQ9774358.1 HAD family hydrolase [Clostridia bacterium]
MQKSSYTHLIWDFNGTLLDDVDACIRSANRLLADHALPPLPSREAYREQFGFPIIDYYRRLGFDFERISYEAIAPVWVEYYMEYSKNATLYQGIKETLAAAQRIGVSQWILSATEQEMLLGQVRSLGILPYFAGVLGMDNIHAYSKEQIGLEWRRTHPDARVLMVGDTDHDAAVAAAMGADCVLLTAGHQSRTRLEACRPRLVADSADEILKLL